MRAQAGAEAAAEIGVQHPHLLRLQAEGAGDVVVGVRDALDLVVHGVGAVLLDDDGGGVRLHRVVVLVGHPVLAVDADLGRVERRRGIAPRLRRRLDAGPLHRRIVGFRRLRREVGARGHDAVIDPHQRGGVARGLEILGHDERHRLAGEDDAVRSQRLERRAGGRHRVLVILRVVGGGRAVLVGEHLDHAGHGLRGRGVDAPDAALGDGARHHHAVGEVGGGELTGVLGEAGDLGRAVDAADGAADEPVTAGRRAELDGHGRLLTGCACRTGTGAFRPRPAPGRGRWRGAPARS
ncbi:hypothetical protein CHKEEEPN_3528 [Methylorubrum podarium]|nr:hypothetical protein CHKEEEPN_3528 [Methylorubrum podarium]